VQTPVNPNVGNLIDLGEDAPTTNTAEVSSRLAQMSKSHISFTN